MAKAKKTKEKVARKPGVCIPWQEKVKELPPIQAKPELVQKVWEDVDAAAYVYIWHCVLSF